MVLDQQVLAPAKREEAIYEEFKKVSRKAIKTRSKKH